GADIDEGDMGRTARKRFKAQGASAGEEIEHPLALEHRAEPGTEDIEHALAHPIRRGTNGIVRRRDQLLAAEFTGNYAHGLAPRLARTRGTGTARRTSTARGTGTARGTSTALRTTTATRG